MFHINDNGDVKPCKSNKEPCPFTNTPHFHSEKEATSHYETIMQGNTVKTNRKYVDIPADLGSIRLRDGDLSDSNARFSLINGLCGDLAQSIIDKENRKIYFVSYNQNKQGLHEDFQKDPNSLYRNATHVMVASTQDGEYLDAYGRRTPADIKDFYGQETSIIEGTHDMLKTYSTGVSEKLSKFAEEALKMDKNNTSYSYHDMPETLPKTSIKLSILPKKGGSYYGTDLPEEAIERQIVAWRNHVGDTNAAIMEENKMKRDGDYSFHITVISPPEMRKLSKEQIKETFQNSSATFNLSGVGTISDGEKETWYVKAHSIEADKIRENLGLPPKDYYATLGFIKGDVFKHVKDNSTIVIH